MNELRRAAAELETRVEQRTQELRTTQAQVIRAEKLAVVGRLAASVGHEVNNPLQAVALHLQLVAEEGLNEMAAAQIGYRSPGIGQKVAKLSPGARSGRSIGWS